MGSYHNIQKLTDQQWLNLYDVAYTAKDNSRHHWLMSSRKARPIRDAARADAVFIVPILTTPQGNRLVLTKEYRVTIDDVEYSFPAGLIDTGETIESTVRREMKEETGLDVDTIHHISPPVYSSAIDTIYLI